MEIRKNEEYIVQIDGTKYYRIEDAMNTIREDEEKIDKDYFFNICDNLFNL